jgi:hypothetical protein
MRATFLHPEPCFAYNAGDANILSGISAGELDPTFLHPNGCKGRCSSISTLPRASPWQPR